MRTVIFIFVGWMVAVNVFALVALNRVNLAPDTAYSWINPSDTQQEQTWNPVALHARWDSLWYFDIAKNGYYLQENNTLANIVFFPLYPLLLFLGGLVFAGNLAAAGWLISSLFLFLALWYFYKFTKEFYPDINPYLPLFLLLIFPSAFFLNAVYTESLFLFLSIASFYYAKKSQYGKVGVLGALAALTRVTGILLFIPLALEYAKKKGIRLSSLLRPAFLWLLLIPLGTTSFFVFHYIKFGNFFLFLDIQSAWGRSFALNGTHFLSSNPAAAANLILDALFAFVAIAATIAVFKKFGFAFGFYMASTLAIALSTGTLMSIGRYILVLFPMYLLLASVSNIYFKYAWVSISLLFFALYTLLFANYYWAG